MQRTIVVINPHSSKYARVKKDLLSHLPGRRGCTIGKYRIAKTSFEENVATLAKILVDGDHVISVGGDATAAIALNAIMQSQKDVALSVLPYGNFNDLAKTLEKAAPGSYLLCPLDIIVNGKHWRYAGCYATIGMTASSVDIYNTAKMRHRLHFYLGRRIVSYAALANWYFRHRHRHILPSFTINGTAKPPRASDYFAINGRFVARIMKGYADFEHPHTFHSGTFRLANFPRLLGFMIRSIFAHIPATATTGDTLEFATPSTITIQAEGESQTFSGVTAIEIKKSSRPIRLYKGV